MFLFVWRSVAGQEQKFSAVQTHAIAAMLEHILHLGWKFNVAVQLNAHTVGGDGLKGIRLLQFQTHARALLGALLKVGFNLRVGLKNNFAGVAVNNDFITILQLFGDI